MTVAEIKPASAIYSTSVTPKVVQETNEQIELRISERFEILEDLVSACIDGTARSLIISGPPGLGKSFSVKKRLSDNDPNALNYTIIKGYVRATGLIKTLYDFKEKGQVIVFDDADYIFADDTALGLLKAVCDTTELRTVHWLSEGKLFSDRTGEVLPKSFDFHGSVIFLTNLDFDSLIARGHKSKVHFQALISRSHYIDTALKTRKDYIVRIKQVIKQGLMKGMDVEQQIEVLKFVIDHQLSLRELSLRMVIKIASIRKANSPKWQQIARVTCCRS